MSDDDALPAVDSEPAMEQLLAALHVATLLAVDPDGLRGIVLRAWPGPTRDAYFEVLRELMASAAPACKVPANVSADRLIGGIDLAATLARGSPVRQQGILDNVSKRMLVLAMAQQLPPMTAALIAQRLDNANLGPIIACDEGAEDEDDFSGHVLAERLAFRAALPNAAPARPVGLRPLASSSNVSAAQALLPAVTVTDAVLESLAAASIALGIASARPLLFAVAAARANAALHGRTTVEADDAAIAAQLVLAPRATQVPAAPEAQDDQDEQEPRDSVDKDDAGDENTDKGALDDVVLAAAQAALPAGLLQQANGSATRVPRSSAGKAGARAKSRLRGRPLSSRPGALSSGRRLDIVETLRAAAPWQTFRRASRRGPAGPKVIVSRDDFRIRRYEEHQRTLTIVAVDASGSAALERLGEAKGAVELLLAECYVRRDQVALISFRKTTAELLLPPTRSLVRAKRALGDLPGGGGTPLATGLQAAADLAAVAMHQGFTATVVILTDGRANIGRDGKPGREAAEADALAAARALARTGAATVLVDTAARRSLFAAEVAEAMAGRYIVLPNADARRLADQMLQDTKPRRATAVS